MSANTISKQLLEVEELHVEESLFYFLTLCACTYHLSAWKELSDTCALLCKFLYFLKQLHGKWMH
jgi:hypothetical protein